MRWRGDGAIQRLEKPSECRISFRSLRPRAASSRNERPSLAAEQGAGDRPKRTRRTRRSHRGGCRNGAIGRGHSRCAGRRFRSSAERTASIRRGFAGPSLLPHRRRSPRRPLDHDRAELRAQRRRLMRSLAFIFIGTLLIAAIAVLTARSLIAPLSQLATAADALGRSPEIIETPRPGIREFAAIHKAFETMQTRLKRFVGERTHMLAAISHDLRTPLTRLRIQAEFIGDGELREGMLANI